MKKIIFMLMFAILIFNISAYNVTEQVSLENCFKNSDLVVSELNEANLNHLRIDDLIVLIENSYSMQADFNSIMKKCDEIENVKEMAFNSLDRVQAMKLFYEQTLEEGVSHIDSLVEEAYSAFNNEQYELIEKKTNAIYDEIIEYKSSQNSIKMFYNSKKNQAILFLRKNYEKILIYLGILVLLFFIFYKKIRIWIIKRKISEIEIRKNVLLDLIKKNQRSYFKTNKISSELYEVRLNKFGEMIRDLDKDILTLKEQLIRIKDFDRKGNSKTIVEKLEEDLEEEGEAVKVAKKEYSKLKKEKILIREKRLREKRERKNFRAVKKKINLKQKKKNVKEKKLKKKKRLVK